MQPNTQRPPNPAPREQHGSSRGQTIVKGIVLAAAAAAMLWLAHEILDALLLLFLALVLSIVLNAPVTWLEQKGMRRGLATLLAFLVMVVVFGLVGWLVVPRFVTEATSLTENLPDYVARLTDWMSHLARDYPDVEQKVPTSVGEAADLMPSLSRILRGAGQSSLSVLGSVALLLVLLALILYMVAQPRPLLELYLRVFPVARQGTAARAFTRASVMVVGWMWSNIVVGTMEAVLTGLFLSFMGVPAALVWASLAFFAELVPKLGLYIMAVPPVLVALATDPWTALWVGVFYLVMNEIMGNLVTPRVRASTMDLHPASTLFTMLAMGTAFGLVGALIATPMAAFIKAYYEEFYLAGRPKAPALDERVEAMLTRETVDPS